MTKRSKKYEKARTALGEKQVFSIQEGVAKMKDLAFARFDESVDVHVNLGIDPEKGDQVVRGSVLLPHGIGKAVKVLVFAKGDQVADAQKAGADYVGAEDLVEKIEGGWLDFDYAVATPDMMGLVGKVARILGPRGLLPNKKTGTVTFEVKPIITDLKRGRLFFKNDKSGLVHFRFGKVSFSVEQLVENLQFFLKALSVTKPAAAKGKFFKKVVIASTMGVGISLSVGEQ